VPYTLLLADDSVTIQRVIELTFADQDVTVVAVSDGDQAIERLEASPPDIVLADIGMPGKNGYEVAQHIRRSPHLSHIPVILLTGAFEPVDQARAAEAGCDGVLAKPFEPQLVIGRVKDLLARGHSAETRPVAVRAEAVAVPAPPAISRPPAPAQEIVRAAAPAESVSDLNDYFDRLDAAFSNVTPSASAPPAPASSSPAPAAAAPGAAEIDWFSAISPAGGPAAERWDPSPSPLPPPPLAPPPPPAVEPPDLPLSYASPQPPEPFDFESAAAPVRPEFAPPPAAAPAAVDTSAASAPAPQAPPIAASTLPPLADAFAALLAAEEHEAASPSAAAWPGVPVPPPAAHEDLVDEVTRRVLDRLSDRVVRDTVADIVSKIAEQLVRDEIEKIKAAIR
jgi:CheY-like chemotaxis protein